MIVFYFVTPCNFGTRERFFNRGKMAGVVGPVKYYFFNKLSWFFFKKIIRLDF